MTDRDYTLEYDEPDEDDDPWVDLGGGMQVRLSELMDDD